MGPSSAMSLPSLIMALTDQLTFELDSDHCLVCTTAVENISPQADPKSDKVCLSGQVSAEATVKKLQSYKLQNPATLSGDAPDAIIAAIREAEPAKPASEVAAVQAADAASAAAAVEDY
uniref:Uncharacterized protein n=1 Tax=Rhizochromulina marina TaxID=1034831 RepID=A0A7S2RT95_9STRA|mmetsp:Transcript_20732/g.60586  ORF Transcript_20732/g.60586 Transcript_20732/m.60586 type:complete len:119 (+) Transcript_20732:193-549(+)